MRWLSAAEVIGLHGSVMRRMGWPLAPLLDEGAVESAVMRPQMAARYDDADPSRQAALLSLGISQAQAFLDGNKRTAYAALEVFLYLNGLRLATDSLTAARELERVAEAADRRAAEAEFEVWLRGVVTEGPPPPAHAGNPVTG
jgi:death-on-curing protein